MVHTISLNDDSRQSHLISSTYVNNVEDIHQNSQVDLDEYVNSHTFNMDTSSICHHKITIFLGGIVLLISVIVAVVALTVISGIAQSILLGGAFAGIIVGGSSFLKSLIGIIYNRFKKEENLSHMSKNAKTALLIGVGLSVFGFFSRLVVISIPGMGNYGQILEKIGSTAYDMGTFSVFNALTQLIYNKLFFKSSNKEIHIDPSVKSDESKKNVFTSLLLLSIGTGLAVLGISLLIVGSVALTGSGQVLALAFSVPFLASGISLVMKNLINFPWQSIKELFENKLSEKKKKHLSSELLHSQKEIRNAFLETNSLNNIEKKMTIDADFSLEKKIALTVSIFFLLFALSLVLTSVFLPGPVLQIKLLSSIGGVILSTSLPVMISGISAISVYLKNKNHWLNKVKIKNNKILGRVNNPSELENSEKIVDLEKIVQQQEILNQKFETKVLILLASLSILFGIGFMLLSLVPGSFSVAGIIAIGSPFLIMGGLILVDKVVLLLREELQRISLKKEKRKKRLSNLPNFVQEAIEEVI